MKTAILQWLLVFVVACSPMLAQEPSSMYVQNCATCHGVDGRANTVLGRTLKLRDLRSPQVQELSEDELVAILSKGADRGKMPGFEKKLGAEAVRKMSAYVREIDVQSAPLPQPVAATRGQAGAEPADVGTVYSAKCSHCHGADGSGNTVLGRTLKLVDMRSREAQKYSDNELLAIIANGTDRGKMPGFQKKLGPEIVDGLASYVRRLVGRPAIVAKINAMHAGASNQLAPSGSLRPAVQVEAAAGATDQAQAHAQPQESKPTVQTTMTSRWARLARANITRKNVGPGAELVDLNFADKEALMTLPGITPDDMVNIIASRPYKSTLQFKTGNIIAPEKYAQIANRIIAKQAPRASRDSTANSHTQESVDAKGVSQSLHY